MATDRVICLKDAFRTIYYRLAGVGFPWVLTGSTAFSFRGMNVQPNDIDIQTDKTGAYEIERLFTEDVVQRVRFSSTESIRSYFGSLLIGGICVEIMGDIQKRREDGTWDDPADLTSVRKFLEVDDMRIPVLSLEYEYEAYVRLGRSERAEMLHKRLRLEAREGGKS